MISNETNINFSNNYDYYHDLELDSHSDDESIELSEFVPSNTNEGIQSLEDYKVTDLTKSIKDFLLDSLQKNNEKLAKSDSYESWKVGAFFSFQMGCTFGSEILVITLTSLSVLTNPIGLIVGGASLLLVGIAGLGYTLYCHSKELSSEQKANIKQNQQEINLLLNLLNENEEFRNHLQAIKSDKPFSLEDLIAQAQPFLTKE